MAPGAVAPALVKGAPTLSAKELREIQEYEKIVQFKDAVLAGTHPRIKVPPHLASKQINASARNISSSTSTTPRQHLHTQPIRTTTGSRVEDVSSFHSRSPNNARSAAGAHIPMTSKSEINPILLEKSDDLIKAEMQLQRQRLERGLREQIEQQRIASRALMQTTESLPDFDISEILSKALAIVPPSTTAPEAEPANSSVEASDSFDNNTFYTSEHYTPEILSPVQTGETSVEVQSHSAPEQRGLSSTVPDREVVVTGTSLPNDNNTAMQARPQMLHSQNSTPNRLGRPRESGNSGSSSSSEEIVSSGAQGAVKVSIPRTHYQEDIETLLPIH